MTLLSELAEEAAEVLEPNLQFFRTDPEDKTRYLIGPEALHAIAWAATTIAVPLLLVGLSEIVKTYVKRWLEKSSAEKAATAQTGLPTPVGAEIERLIAARRIPASDDEQVKLAVTAVADYLSRRGWPAAFAAADAESIVLAVKQRLNGPTST